MKKVQEIERSLAKLSEKCISIGVVAVLCDRSDDEDVLDYTKSGCFV
jgi:hypothetical protein